MDATSDTDFVLSVSGPKRAPLLSGSGTTTLVFGYTVLAADVDANGIWIGPFDRTLAGDRNGDTQNGTITSVATGVKVNFAHSALDTLGGHRVDGGRSIVLVEVTSTPMLETDTYGADETIQFTVTFNAAVDVTGDPVSTFSLGSPDDIRNVNAEYESGTGTAELVFGYTVLSSDVDSNGIYQLGGEMDFDTVKGPVGLDADDAITFTVTSADAPLAYPVRVQRSDHKVDGSQTAGVSSDATLSGLTVTAGGTDLVTFASGTTDYTASVANDVAEVTVTAETTDSGATVAYLDGSDMTLDDADTGVDGHQVTLAEGDNVIKVKVTAADGSTKTYTVTVSRAEAEAPTTTTFVSNLGQTDVSANSTILGNVRRAQQFETGSNPGGYTLSEIVVNIRDARTGTPAFALYTSTSDDKPDTKVVDLSGDSSTAGEQSFTPASATTLSASTKYIIVFQVTSGIANLQMTSSDDIDSGASPGWDIAETGLYGDPNWRSIQNTVEIAVKGTAVVGGTPSSDATLSGLTVTAGGTDLVTFASDTETYTAMVANDVVEVTVTATKNDSGASIDYLDVSDMTLDDADTGVDGHQVTLAEGDNVVKVKVTAADTTTKTYTVTVNRAAAASTCTLNTGDLWCGVVTVGTSSNGVGFVAAETETDTDVGALTDNNGDQTITIESDTYTIPSLLVLSGARAGTLAITLDKSFPTDDVNTLEFDVGSKTFKVSEATAYPTGHGYFWADSDLTWSDGGPNVTLRLRRAATLIVGRDAERADGDRRRHGPGDLRVGHHRLHGDRWRTTSPR